MILSEENGPLLCLQPDKVGVLRDIRRDTASPACHHLLVLVGTGREIISNLAKAAGLATMIATMRPDIDNLDEYVRNTTARAFAVVASALGIPALLPFLKAVCQSRKSWQARHTGIKIVMQVRWCLRARRSNRPKSQLVSAVDACEVMYSYTFVSTLIVLELCLGCTI